MSRKSISNTNFLKQIDSLQYEYELEDFLCHYKLTKDQIEYLYCINKVKKAILFLTQKINEDFVLEHLETFNLAEKYSKLSESFLREFKDDLNWETICKYQQLSEQFMRENKDNLDWKSVSEYQNISYKFIKEFRNNLDWELLKNNPRLEKKKLLSL